MRRAFAACSKAFFNFIYRASSPSKPRKDQVVFLSRQADEPSYDYVELSREFERRGWTSVMHLKKVTKRNLIPYAYHVVKEVRLLAKSKAAILDRYDPVVSMLEFECAAADDAGLPAECVHREFPLQPVVMQLWHAFGAYKRFGYQSIGTREGHSRDVIDAFSIHRNYSWVVCSGEQCRPAFAEAFSCPIDRVVALDRPEYDELASMRQQRSSVEGKTRVLMAPTLRKSASSEHPFKELYERRVDFERLLGDGVEVVWSFHPLESGLPAPGNVSQTLVDADILVTDYSSIVYEAYLLGKPVLFYIPDIDKYVVSPGLNANPAEASPGICLHGEEQLAERLQGIASGEAAYDFDQLEAFAGGAFGGIDRSSGTAASRFVDFVIAETQR